MAFQSASTGQRSFDKDSKTRSASLGRSNLRKKSIKGAGVAFGLLLASAASAVPTQYGNSSSLIHSANNPTNSEILADTENPRLGYVLPSSAGTVNINRVSLASTNNNFCQEMAILQGTSERLARSLDRLTKRVEELSPEVEKARKDYFEKKAEAEAAFASNEDLQEIQNLTVRYEDIEIRLKDVYDWIGDSEDRAKRDELRDEAKQLKSERLEIRKELRDLRREARHELRAYKRLTKKADVLKDYFEGMEDSLDRIQKRIIDSKESIYDLYSFLGKLEGGYVTAVYESGWDENLKKLRDSNSNLQYRKARVSEAKLYFQFMNNNEKKPQLGLDSLRIVLDYSVAGAGQLNEVGEFANSIPSVLTTNMRVSTIASCAILNSDLFNIQRDKANVPVFGASISYKYDAAFLANVNFSYNLNQIYEFMKKSKKKGGFFSTKSKTKVSEDMSNTTAFTADWKNSDSDNTLSRKDKEAIEEIIKNELIDEVLHVVGEPLYLTPSRIPGGQVAPSSGASTIAEGLESVCGRNHYCQAGSFILKGLDSVFGTSTSATEYRKKFNRTASRTFKTEDVRKKPGFIAFNPE